MYRVAAYITAYNDVDAVQRCIDAIQKQSYYVEKIYIVDNSYDPLSQQLSNLTNLIIDYHPENIGIAEGLELGIKWSIKKNYDFLWTFDQDSEPLSDTLEKLITKYDDLLDKKRSVGIIAPLPIDRESHNQLHGLLFNKYRFSSILNNNQDFKDNCYECDAVITSGSLVCLSAAKKVAMPNKDLFIDAVDWDYCIKFRAKGYSVIVCIDAILEHNFGNYKNQLFKNKFVISHIYNYPALRYYYISRNHTYMETRLSKKNSYLHVSIIYRFYSLIKKIAKILLCEQEQKMLKIWAAIRGTYEGFLGRLGKNW